ncbi:Maf/Ham1 [Phellopilus nigrolimitatus]|nr:Maf/Ham1 [Phellopilus nigrolimitatus]
MSSRTLIFATGNAHKPREVQAILSDGSSFFASINLESKDLDELQGTTQDVAHEECRRAAELVHLSPIFISDVALCFEATNSLPGPYFKHFRFPTTDAYAICTFAYSAGPGTEPVLFESKTEGKIALPRGPQDFGWDCTLEAEGVCMLRIYHCYRALEKLRAYLQSLA